MIGFAVYMLLHHDNAYLEVRFDVHRILLVFTKQMSQRWCYVVVRVFVEPSLKSPTKFAAGW